VQEILGKRLLAGSLFLDALAANAEHAVPHVLKSLGMNGLGAGTGAMLPGFALSKQAGQKLANAMRRAPAEPFQNTMTRSVWPLTDAMFNFAQGKYSSD